jgi:hypothetical protein
MGHSADGTERSGPSDAGQETSPEHPPTVTHLPTVTLSWTVGNDAFNAEWNECTKDTEAEDGVGLPGSHGCGDQSVPSSQVYLG